MGLKVLVLGETAGPRWVPSQERHETVYHDQGGKLSFKKDPREEPPHICVLFIQREEKRDAAPPQRLGEGEGDG